MQNRVLLLNIILSDNLHHSSIISFFVTLVFAAIMAVSILLSLGSARCSSRSDINISFLHYLIKLPQICPLSSRNSVTTYKQAYHHTSDFAGIYNLSQPLGKDQLKLSDKIISYRNRVKNFRKKNYEM